MHQYIVGRTGFGKSTFLENHALDNKSGFLLLDPHGDSAEKLGKHFTYWNPATDDFGFNPLKDIPLAQRHLVAEQVVAAMRAFVPDSWGPNLEDVMRNSMRVLLDNNLALPVFPRFLSDVSFRKHLLERVTNDEIRRFWKHEFPAKSERQQAEELRSTQNKVRLFATDPVLARVLTQSTLSISHIINSGHRLVVNLSKGQLGDAPSHLLGALLVTTTYQAARSGNRRPFTLYADEFQNFATDTFSTILSEARKYRLELIVAHQYLGQINESLRQSVFGNVGRFTVFNVSAEDADILAKEYFLHTPDTIDHGFHSPYCERGLHTPRALTDLPPFHIWVKEGLRLRLEKTAPPQ